MQSDAPVEKASVSKLEVCGHAGLERAWVRNPTVHADTEGPGMRCLMIDTNLLGFWGLAAVAGTLGTRLWLVMVTVHSAMKVLVLAPDVKLFLLDASKPSLPEKGAAQSSNNPCYLELQGIRICLSGINRLSEAARCDGDRQFVSGALHLLKQEEM